MDAQLRWLPLAVKIAHLRLVQAGSFRDHRLWCRSLALRAQAYRLVIETHDIPRLAVPLAIIFYGRAYRWGIEDVRFVLIRGSLMALVFWIVAILQYFWVRNRR